RARAVPYGRRAIDALSIPGTRHRDESRRRRAAYRFQGTRARREPGDSRSGRRGVRGAALGWRGNRRGTYRALLGRLLRLLRRPRGQLLGGRLEPVLDLRRAGRRDRQTV